VNSATAALHLSLEAVGVGRDDEVIVPTMTFAATGEVVTYFGAKPVLVDSQADTLNIDPILVARAITPRTKAIVPVHFGGQACDIDPLLDLAAQTGVKIVEDAAHALPTKAAGRMIGTIGHMTCFSFYATKTITTGEGGMITTESDDYAERMRIMSLHGISKDAWKRYTAEGSWYYEILEPGFKYNLTDLAAALGVEQLQRHRAFWETRTRIAGLYGAAFRDMPEIEPLAVRPDNQHAWHLYVVQLDLERLRLNRRQFIEELKRRQIGASVHFIPLHLHPYYRRVYGHQAGDFPVASAAFERIVSLPIHTRMTDADVFDVIEAVRSIVQEYRR
jgi:dTDP-4-amino-4,6-dideoxygalactose transaminase